jgi:hypothetical protein
MINNLSYPFNLFECEIISRDILKFYRSQTLKFTNQHQGKILLFGKSLIGNLNDGLDSFCKTIGDNFASSSSHEKFSFYRDSIIH